MCTLTQGFALETCADGHGGMKSLRVAAIATIASVTTSVAGVVTAITMVATNKFFHYQFKKETGSFKEDELVSDENGTIEYVPTIEAKMNRLSSVKRKELALLAQNNIVAIAEDNNGKFWLLGEVYGLTKSGTRDSGKMFADFNGSTLSFKGKELEPFKEVDSTIITALTFV